MQGFMGWFTAEKHGEGWHEGDKGSLEGSGFLYAEAYGGMCSTNGIFSVESRELGFGKQD